jgi:hypothetical protein
MLARLDPVDITRGTVADIDDVRPLWVSVPDAHREAMRELEWFEGRDP